MIMIMIISIHKKDALQIRTKIKIDSHDLIMVVESHKNVQPSLNLSHLIYIVDT